MREIVSASIPCAPKSCRSVRSASSSSGVTTSPRVSMRSIASRVYSMAAGGSGFSIIIQPASGPGVQERARWRICLKPWVVIRPTLAPLPSRTALVATVVPCIICAISPGEMLAERQIFSIPASTPTDGSLGVDGVLARTCRPLSSSKRMRSVNVPPTSTPSLKDMKSLHFLVQGHRSCFPCALVVRTKPREPRPGTILWSRPCRFPPTPDGRPAGPVRGIPCASVPVQL